MKCFKCGENIHPYALGCPFCGSWMRVLEINNNEENEEDDYYEEEDYYE